MTALGRNDPCHCGSGKKYKNCHLDADEAKERATRAKEDGAKAAPAPEGEPQKAAPAAPRHQTRQPWKGGAQNTRGFQKVTASRKVGGGG